MAERRNPFTPTFGIVPPHLAGRSQILNEMSQAFMNGIGDPNLSSILIGPRGCGKTALLSCVADEARQRGWIAVTAVAAPGMLEDILQRAMAAAADFVAPNDTRKLTGLSAAQLLGLEWTLQPESPENWRTRMTSLLDELKKLDIGLLVNIDEVNVSVDEMVQLAATYQLLIGEGYKMALVMAGLPKNTIDLLENDSVSFLRRSRRRHLDRIADKDVAEAMMRTISDGGKSVKPQALDAMVKASGGYAYMVQLVGYYSWLASATADEISFEHAQAGMRNAQEEFESGVLESTYREMSAGDRAFAYAMLEDAHGSTLTAVAARMGKGTNYASTYKKRLETKGVIVEEAGKTFSFAVPGLDAYLRKLAQE